jgi:hypothetical protein
MSTVFFRPAQLEPQPTMRRLRNHAALVRALLDELDRVAPPAGAGLGVQQCVAAQLAEEVARLGCRMLEYAAAIAVSDDVSSDGVARPGE